jgi:predicted outer membrane protein
MNLQKLLSTVAFAASLADVRVLPAQNRPPTQPRPAGQVQPAPPGTTAQPGPPIIRWNTDHMLAAFNVIDNQEEVAIARYAQSRTDNGDVSDFAAAIAREHQNILAKLERFAPDAVRDDSWIGDETANATAENPLLPAGEAAAGQPIRRTTGPLQPGATTPRQPLEMIPLHRELATQCLRDTRKALDGKKDAEFDECFIGRQIAVHAAMQSKLAVLQRHATPELAKILQEESAAIRTHLQTAEQLMHQLVESKPSKATAPTNPTIN